jgi:uncharacterized protein (TIGR00251 family)
MLLSIYVKPGSRQDQIEYDQEGNLKVKIRAQPVDGKANKYLVEYLSKVFGVPKSYIQILKGTTNQHKKVEIEGEDEKLREVLDKIKNT